MYAVDAMPPSSSVSSSMLDIRRSTPSTILNEPMGRDILPPSHRRVIETDLPVRHDRIGPDRSVASAANTIEFVRLSQERDRAANLRFPAIRRVRESI